MTAAVPPSAPGWPLSWRIGFWAALAGGVLTVWFWGSTLVVLRATEIVVFVVAFSGLHLLSGRLGLISVGHGAFMGIGAVVAAHAVDDFSIPYLLAPVAGALGGAAFGAIIAAPSLRLPGAYLALLTLAVATLLPIALRQIDGPLGYRVQGDLVPPTWAGLEPGQNGLWQFGLVLVGAVIIMGVVHGAVRGRFTRSLIAARDEPAAAAAFGIPVGRVQLIGVSLSAALAGAAGGLGLYASPLVSGEQYPFTLSVAMFALMLGLGASRLWTSVPAAIVLVSLPDLLTRAGLPIWEPIIYATILLLMTRISRGRGLVSLLEPTPEVAGPVVVPTERRTSRREPHPASGNPWLLTPEPPPPEGETAPTPRIDW